MILGFLTEQPLCGYTLRKKMEQLQGSTRTFSDGAIYPAAKRLVESGMISQSEEVMDGRPRRQFTLEQPGRERLAEALADADGFYISDLGKWNVVLTFLSFLKDKASRDAVLRRRYDYLIASDRHYFYCDSGRALETQEIEDPYRHGLVVIHEAAFAAELEWIRSMLGIDGQTSKATPNTSK